MTVKLQEPSKYVEACIKALCPVTKIIPHKWLPAYLSFFRVAGQKITAATTYRLPAYLYSLNLIPGAPSPQISRPSNLRQLLFGQRIKYIREHNSTSFIANSEEAFNDVMSREKVRQIDPWDEDKRRFLFDLPRIGEIKQVTAATHLWSDTYHISSSIWSLPCVRCEYLHKSMWSWWTSGEKCVVWKDLYAPLMIYRRI